MTKWSKFYSIFTKFWLHGHTFTLSHVWESSKSFWKYSLFIWGLKCARIFSEKVYFPRNRCKSYLFRPVCKKYKICQKKNPFVFRALNQNSDSYKSCLCMLATFCMSQNVNLELWKRMGFFWHSTIFGTKVENASKILQRTEYKVLRHLITLPHYPDDM